MKGKIQMVFDYKTLKECAQNGSKLGAWKGKAVFACSVNDLDNAGSGVYFILYDDKNQIVGRVNDEWRSYGTVDKSGSVTEYPYSIRIKATEEKSESCFKMEAATTYTPGYDTKEKPVGDVKLGADVEMTLRVAKEMTVESLLEGFLPGVCYNVAKN